MDGDLVPLLLTRTDGGGLGCICMEGDGTQHDGPESAKGGKGGTVVATMGARGGGGRWGKMEVLEVVTARLMERDSRTE